MINKIYLWWKFEGQFILRNTKIGVKNLWKWFPIIWKDRNWDHSCIFHILKFKLKNQSEYIKKTNIFVDSKRESEKIDLCIKLIEKINEEYYTCEYQDYLNENIWFEKCKKEDYYTVESKVLDDNLDLYFKKYPIIHNKVLNGKGILNIDDNDPNLKRKYIAINMGIINHQRANSLLFKILETNIQNWWM